jgi:hypothetical protein
MENFIYGHEHEKFDCVDLNIHGRLTQFSLIQFNIDQCIVF